MSEWLTLSAVALTSAAVTWIVATLRFRFRLKDAARAVKMAESWVQSAETRAGESAEAAERAKVRADEFFTESLRQKRRGDEFFGIIEGVEQEADGWRKMWKEGMQKTGAAQAWLLRDLALAMRRANGYAARLRAKGETVEDLAMEPKLEALLQELDEAQRLPAERKVEAVKAAEALEKQNRAQE